MLKKFNEITLYGLSPGMSRLHTISIPRNGIIGNIHCSSSARGKYRIYLNKENVATLYGSLQSLNISYFMKFAVLKDDELSVECTNTDVLACDFHVNFAFFIKDNPLATIFYED